MWVGGTGGTKAACRGVAAGGKRIARLVNGLHAEQLTRAALRSTG